MVERVSWKRDFFSEDEVGIICSMEISPNRQIGQLTWIDMSMGEFR